MTGSYVGVDVGGSSVRLLAQRGDGARTPVAAVPVPGSYREFLDLVQRLAGANADGPVAAMGCALPGTVEGDRAGFVPALPWIEGQPVGADLAEALGCPVRLGVDGHLTLLAEAREGAARDHRSAVLVAVGTGIGGAVMTGGRIWRGAHGSAGSWGWLPAAGTRDDHRHGPYERAAAGRALDDLAAPMSAPDLVSAARSGDPAAGAAMRTYADRLSRGLAALASIFDPDVVIVGGGLSSAMDVLEPTLRRGMAEYASPDGRRVPLRPAALGPAAGVIGALRAALDEGEVWL